MTKKSSLQKVSEEGRNALQKRVEYTRKASNSSTLNADESVTKNLIERTVHSADGESNGKG